MCLHQHPRRRRHQQRAHVTTVEGEWKPQGCVESCIGCEGECGRNVDGRLDGWCEVCSHDFRAEEIYMSNLIFSDGNSIRMWDTDAICQRDIVSRFNTIFLDHTYNSSLAECVTVSTGTLMDRLASRTQMTCHEFLGRPTHAGSQSVGAALHQGLCISLTLQSTAQGNQSFQMTEA